MSCFNEYKIINTINYYARLMRKKSSRIETFENQVYSQDTVASYV